MFSPNYKILWQQYHVEMKKDIAEEFKRFCLSRRMGLGGAKEHHLGTKDVCILRIPDSKSSAHKCTCQEWRVDFTI